MIFLIYKCQQAIVSMFPTAQLHAAVHLCTLSDSSCSSLTQASLPLPALHRRPQYTGSQCIKGLDLTASQARAGALQLPSCIGFDEAVRETQSQNCFHK